MATVVVPYRGPNGKTRLDGLPDELRQALVLGMLGDVLAAARVVGEVVLVTDDQEGSRVAGELGARLLADPGGGQAAAVAAALAGIEGPVLVVNADLPCVVPDDLRALLDAIPDEGLALVAAEDGTTNALALASPELFAPLYGPGSAEEFRSHAAQLGLPSVAVTNANLADDLDTVADLARLERRLGPRTRGAVRPMHPKWPE